MKLNRLNPKAVRTSTQTERVTVLTTEELERTAGAIEPFSCAWTDGSTIHYHNGYPRAV